MGDEYHGVQVERDGEHAVWASKKDGENAVYVALFNFNDEEREVKVKTEDVYNALSIKAFDSYKNLVLEELWTGEIKESNGEMIAASVKTHGAKLFCVKTV